MAVFPRISVFLFVIVAWLSEQSAGVQTRANPIRRVITMLQMMMKKSDDTALLEEKLFDKYMCQCKKNLAQLQKSIEASTEKVPQLESAIQETSALKASLTQELAQAKEDKASAESSLKEAKAMRDGDAKTFAKESTESKENIKAMAGAVKALRKGMNQGEFLQTEAAPWLQGLLAVGKPAKGYDREALSAFLQEGDQSEDSGEIIGILEQMKEDMENDLKSMIKTEQDAIAQFQALSSAKTKQITAAVSAIEEKSVRLAGTKVQLVQLKADLEDTKEKLEEDSKAFGETRTSCQKRDTEYAVLKKQLAEERVALADTIKILSDDQALDLFKKTAVSSASSAAATFLQVGSVSRWRRQQALKLLQDTSAQHPDQPALQLIAKRVASVAKKRHVSRKGFEKINALIDNMIVMLGKEAKDELAKKDYCTKTIPKNEDMKATLENGVKTKTALINNLKDQLSLVEKDMAKLTADLASLDDQVKQATSQRKEENGAFGEMLSETNQAVGILEVAKKRLKEFYPSFVQEGSEDTVEAPSFFQESDSSTESEGENDEYTFMDSGAASSVSQQKKKPQNDAGKAVLKMIDTIQSDLKKEFAVAKAEETQAQEDYEELLTTAKKKREISSRAMTEKEGAKAGLQEELKKQKDKKKGLEDELKETIDVIKDLHDECDDLLKSFAERTKLRDAEVEALRKTKSVLAGADYKG
jgi:septal ring factor EnvC (AmiA/AmiB activator)